jgi:hypothetical protein
MIFTLLMLILLTPLFAVSEEVANIFGDGVFDTKWGMNIDEVAKIFPNGKKGNNLGIVIFEVIDDRPILDITRRKKDKITFVFDDIGRLSSVSVGFKYDYEILGRLVSKFNTVFGKSELDVVESNPINDSLSQYTFSKFEWKDGKDISISLVSAFGFLGGIDSLDMNIINNGLKKPEVSKESLGF